jgi:hypothetical protein
MAKDIELYANFDTFTVFKEFKKAVREKIIENGLDISLTLSTKDLKSELSYVVNQKIMMNKPDPTAPNTPNPTTNGLSQPTVNIPKSEDELLKFLTNGKTDPSKYNKAKDFSTLNESNIVFGFGSKGTAAANRVTLRMEIDDQETVSTQFQKAQAFFQNAVFALPDSAGNMNYYMNPGIDISQFVKIKCSVLAGDGDSKTRKGMSPVERFNRNKTSKGYADWTLKQDAVDMIRKNYVNITEVMSFLKQGDTDRAQTLLDVVDKNNKLTDVKTQITKLQTNANIPTTTQSYTNAIKLVNNLKLIKKISQEEVIYTLISDFDDFANNEIDFFENIKKAIRGWVRDHEDYWFASLVKRVEKLIKEYESEQ